MNLRDKNLGFLLVYTLFMMLVCWVLFPSFRLLFFAPFLITTFYQKSYGKAIYYSLFAGLFIDLFSSPLRLGLHALNYSLTTALIYSQKRNLFSDNVATLPIMTVLFSLVSTSVQVLLIFIFSKPLSFSFYFLFSDLLLMPFFDGLWAFCFFVLVPLFFRQYLLKRAF